MKLTASDGEGANYFGTSVSLEGDRFIISTYFGTGIADDTGNAYTGNVSSFTTVDTGGVSQTISRLSFVSQEDWVIGDTTDENELTLGKGDVADLGSEHDVFIGRSSGADGNVLRVRGTVIARTIYLGAGFTNDKNVLRLERTAVLRVKTIRLASGGSLVIQGKLRSAGKLLGYLRKTKLQVLRGTQWKTINARNAPLQLAVFYKRGYTTVCADALPTPPPE